IKKACEEFPLQRVKNSAPILSQDDVMDIQEYLKNTPMHKSVANILDGDSGYFKFMLLHSDYLSDDSMIRAINLLWNENKNISRLFATLIGAYRKMKFNPVVYVPFQAVLKRYGTLLDVARLDEIFDEPETPPAEYCGTVDVRLQDGTEVTMNKGELSALAAELRMNLPTQKDVVPDVTNASRDFLNVLDILDFPGERRPESMDARKLEQGKNLSVVLRRGKVTYLFNRYSDSKRISSLMLCHNNQQSAESTMSSVLGNWINKNVGDTATARRTFMAESVVSPLFIISTFFNKDLECQSNDKPEQFDALRKRWDNRFKIVLEKEVLRANTDEEGTHWFNNWDGQPFKNIFMLRDFKYSKPIFSGYDPNIGTPEQGIVATPSFPDFLGTLKRSFVEYDFVKQHFADPSSSWDDAATLRNDGTRRIISSLNKLAPNVEAARNKKFATDVLNYSTKLSQLLNKYHHDGGVDEEIKKAKRQAAEANFQLGLLVGKDTAGFGSFIDTLMVDEPHIYEIVHREIMNEMAPPVLNGVEESIFIQYGLSTSSTREENLRRLCMGLGVDSEEECKSILESYGVDLEKLLSTSKIMTGSSEHLVEMVENYWFDDYLLGHSVEVLKDRVASVTGIVVKLQKLYKMLDVRSTILLRVNQYLTTFSRSSAINIIADYLAMELNRFVCSFGYDFMSDKQREDIWKNNVRLDLRIDQNTVSAQNEARGV
ncbi:MAG: hypothetical protein IK092_07910, partial [Muribaculaceae bacterium]|nr:hypothetical protein [Muribaculaceae bacterium]